jgi:uncharacterized protein
LATKARRGGKPKNDVPRIESIPADVVLAPQAEAPRHLASLERTGKRTRVREMSWMEFDRLVQALSRTIKKTFLPDAVVGVAHGGVFVGGAIASALGVEFHPVRISRRSRDKAGGEGSTRPKLAGEMPKSVKGRRVLVVDDVASSGDTLDLARSLLEKVGAAQIATATLICREGGYQPDHHAITADELFVFPWDYEIVDDARFTPEKGAK